MAEIKQFAKTTITDLRSAIWGLSKDITVRDFEMKIASEIQKAQQDNLSVELDFTSDYGGNLNSITAVNALRIVQEALQNALKHANATVIEIVVVMERATYKLPFVITVRESRIREMVLACALWNSVLRKWEQHFQLSPLKKVR